MDIYFIRHGQSEANKTRIVQGWLDSPLSEEGILQAEKLQGVLPDNFDRVYISPLERAKTTAIIALQLKETDDRIEFEDDLREIHIGSIEGIPIADLDVPYEEMRKWVTLQEDTLKGKYGSEKISEFLTRTSEIFEEIVKKEQSSNNKTILIFCHGGVMRSILSNKLQLISVEDSHYENTEVVHIRLANGHWHLQKRSLVHLN